MTAPVLRFAAAAAVALSLAGGAVAATPATGAVVGQLVTGVAAPGVAPGVEEGPAAAAADRLLATMTDADLRRRLRADLIAQGAAEAEPRPAASPFAETAARIAGLAVGAAERLGRWTADLRALPGRAEEIRARLDAAPRGTAAMLGAFALLAAAGFGAAAATSRALAPARRSLTAGRPGYGGRLVRTAALTLVELAPPAVFVAATLAAAPSLRGTLGPLWDYVWIWHSGLSAGWTARVVARRLFAADAPALRIAALDDAAATALEQVVRRGSAVAVAGWLAAGLFPTLGAGIGPAILTVLAAGSAVAILLLATALRSRRAIGAAALRVLAPGAAQADGAVPADAPPAVAGEGAASMTAPGPDAARTAPTEAGSAAPALALAAPWAMAAYVVCGWAWWAAHWLESGVQRLAGPLGCIALLFALPVFDRGAQELAGALAGRGEMAARLRPALLGAFRAAIGLGALFAASSLWGLDLAALVAGPEAAPWARAAFQIAGTLLAAVFAWRLILALLPDAPPALAPVAAEAPAAPVFPGDEGGATSPGAAGRGGTLRPLLRSFLRLILVAAAGMALLSELGLDVAPLLASAGIFGIAVGFGAQTLVRDVFSGIFFLVDDAFRVGEYIELDDRLRGQVAGISPRSLQLRHHLGPVITIPFGELRSVVNHSRDWAIYRMLFRVETDTDPARVKKIVKQVGAELAAHPELGPLFLEPLKSQGVSMIDDDSALVFRVKFRCLPGAQFTLRREVYHNLTRAFAANGVRLARRKVEVVGAGPAADAALLDAAAAAASSPILAREAPFGP